MSQLYSTTELAEMSVEELRAAQANGFVKPELSESEAPGYPSPPSSPQDRYAPTTWGSKYYDFTAPSGQTCQMQKLVPEDLVGTDIIDKITRLPAFAEENIRKAEGQPPMVALSDKQSLEEVLVVLDELLPLVVVQPKLWPEPKSGEEREPGRVYVRDVDLVDRIAIMNRAVGGVAKMDNFRQKP